MPANSTYSFVAGQILTAADLNAVFAQTVAFAADSGNANTGTLPQVRLPYRMDQNVRTTDNVQFNDAVFTGNLTVSGTTTYVNTNILQVKDPNIQIAYGAANSFQANGAGFQIMGANVNFYYLDSSNVVILDRLLSIGNSTVNAVFGYSAVTIGSSFVANTTGVYTTGTANANAFTTSSVTVNTGAIAVGSNVVVNTTSYFVGNSTVNTNVTAGQISLSGQTVNSTVYGGSASYLGGVAAASYVQNTDSRTLSGNIAFSAANVYYNSGLYVGANVVVNTSSHFVGNSTVNTNVTAGQISLSGQTVNSTVYTGLSYSANNSSYLGGTIAASYVQNTDSRTLSGNLTFTGANNFYSSGLVVGANVVVNTSSHFVGNSTVNTNVTAGQISLSGQTVNSTVYGGSASYLGGVAAASYVQNTDSRTLSGNVNFSGANVYYTSGLFVGANVTVNTSTQFVGNSTVNTNIVAGTISLSGQTVNSTVYTGQAYTANNSSYLGGALAAVFVQNNDSRVLSGNLNFTGTNNYFSSVVYVGANVFANTTTISINGQTVNSSVYTGQSYTANNASYLGGTAAANYLTNTGAFTISGVHTHSANVVFSNGSVIIANGSFGTNTQVLISNGSSMYWGTFSANDALSLNGTNAAFFVQNTDSRTLSGNLVFSGANVTFTGGVRIANGVSLFANGSMGTSGQVLSSNGTSLYWQTLTGVNTAAAYTFTGVHTYSANIVMSNGSVINANGGFGTAGQVLASNGTSMYWTNPVTIYYANGTQAYP